MNESEEVAIRLKFIETVLFAALDFIESVYPAQIEKISLYREHSGELQGVKIWAERREP